MAKMVKQIKINYTESGFVIQVTYKDNTKSGVLDNVDQIKIEKFSMLTVDPKNDDLFLTPVGETYIRAITLGGKSTIKVF